MSDRTAITVSVIFGVSLIIAAAILAFAVGAAIDKLGQSIERGGANASFHGGAVSLMPSTQAHKLEITVQQPGHNGNDGPVWPFQVEVHQADNKPAK
jgi:hypothetical protein